MENLTNTEYEPLQVAHFDKRFIARLIDLAFLAPVGWILHFLAEWGKTGILAREIILMIFFVLYWIYLIKRYGATPGKMIMKIKAIRLDGENAGWKEAILREVVVAGLMVLKFAIFLSVYQQLDYAAYLESPFFKKGKFIESYSPLFKYASYLLGNWGLADLIYYLTNGRKQALHDRIAGTLVVRTNPYKVLSY